MSYIPRTVAMIAGMLALAGCGGLSDLIGVSRPTPSTETAPPAANPAPPAVEPARLDKPIVPDRAAVRRLQAALARLGFPSGPIDGIVGPQTRRAIRRYQTANRLKPTGEITQRLLDRLANRKPLPKPPAKPPAPIAVADLPAYLPGTEFIYSNGESERVTDVAGTVVQWARDDGTSYAADRNFLLPRSYWVSRGARGTAEISAGSDELWPQRDGAEVAFSATIKVQSKDAADIIERRVEQWRCRNEGVRSVVVGAGEFDTVILSCRGGAPGARSELSRTWYYAADLRHYVRFVESNPANGSERKIDLVAVRPGTAGWPPIVQAALRRALVRALETPEDDASIPWRSSGVDASVTIKAAAPFTGEDGLTCRRFVQVWTQKGRHRRYPGMACRTAPERWVIPGVRPSTADLLSISRGAS